MSMYNTRFTPDEFAGEVNFQKKCRAVVTPQGEYLCGVGNDCICDLNGNIVAEFSHKKEIVVEGERFVARVYPSPYGEFTVRKGELYLDGELLGAVSAERKRTALILLGFACILLAALITLVALIALPGETLPVIDVRDDNGNWNGQGTIAVFDEVIEPGSEGEYKFIIRNANEEKLFYAFRIEERYNGEETKAFPFEYRVRVNNAPIGSAEWRSASELYFENLILMPQSDYLVELEWRWPFEGGDNAADTSFGRDGGEYSLVIVLTAETISEIAE